MALTVSDSAAEIIWSTLTGKGYDDYLDRVEREANEVAITPKRLPLDDFLIHVPPVYAPSKFPCVPTKEIAAETQYANDWVRACRRNRVIDIEGRTPPIRTRGFTDMLLTVISQESREGLAPSPGIPHRWSPAFLHHHANDFPLISSSSKLFVALAYGVTSRFMVTGLEYQLAHWMAAQHDASISPEMLFRKSYRLNQGDIYLTLLTIENVLSRFWLDDDRDNLLLTRKLKPIINLWQGRGDNFGGWYHLWGMILYGYVEGGWAVSLIQEIESTGSHLLSDKREVQEEHVNRAGGIIGKQLRDAIASGSWRDAEPSLYSLSSDHYLNLIEDFLGRLHIAPYPGLELRLSKRSKLRNRKTPSPHMTYLQLTSHQRALSNCTAKLYLWRNPLPKGVGPPNRWPISERLLEQPINLEKGKAIRLRVPGTYRGARIRLSNCDNTAIDFTAEGS